MNKKQASNVLKTISRLKSQWNISQLGDRNSAKKMKTEKISVIVYNGITFQCIVPSVPNKVRLKVLVKALERCPGQNDTKEALEMIALGYDIIQDIGQH